MLLMVENGFRGGICQAVHKFAKANNKYMTNHDKSQKSAYIQYYDANSLYAWALCQKFVHGFEWEKNILKINDDFMKNYDEDSDKEYVLEVDIEYSKDLADLHSDLPFLPEGMKINTCDKLICNLYNKSKYVAQVKLLKQALNHGLILKKVHRVIQFNQKAWLEGYINKNITLRKEADNDFKRDSFKIMCNSVFGKTMQNVVSKEILN